MTYRFKSLLAASAVSLSLWIGAIYGGTILLPGTGQDVNSVQTAAAE
jgi:hypothetical protein